MDIARQPWPEALGGALLGALLSIFVAFLPGISRLIEQPSTAPYVIATGALVGAAISWWSASRAMRKIVRAEQAVEESQRDERRRAA